jgi:hypothetical protein
MKDDSQRIVLRAGQANEIAQHRRAGLMQASERRLHLGLNAYRSLNTERRPLGPSATRSRPGMTVGHWLPPRPKDRTKCRAVGQPSPARRPRQTREPTPEQRRNTENMLRHRAPTTGCDTSTPRASARPSAALSSPRTRSATCCRSWASTAPATLPPVTAQRWPHTRGGSATWPPTWACPRSPSTPGSAAAGPPATYTQGPAAHRPR